ncbi:hypothetical protein GCG21_11075 [Pseudactinotalea sp. HY160]|uniref:hypothetical protein n=1 Tax=Pseudactinotalea sp. HY160 TaxID=2654490 RepID=UPI00128DA53E|nr:hypothetical protein [Pseudactinotalea sp. HY160]MPV50537.1 hypothetical protein [Pseudactinotalea sp. HY160]
MVHYAAEHRPTIVNPDPRYGTPPFLESPSAGFLHVAAAVDPPGKGPPFVRPSRRRAALLQRLTGLVPDLERLDDVTRVTLFRAIFMPPPTAIARRQNAHLARYDVAVLIETVSLDGLARVQGAGAYRRLLDAVGAAATDSHVMAARCPRRIADVDTTRPGLYLFNYFAGADPDLALALWERLAAWYVAETGMDNSTPLMPVGPGDYPLVNFARWDVSLPVFAIRQFGKRTFRSYVLSNLRANDVGPMPVFYRLVPTAGTGTGA